MSKLEKLVIRLMSRPKDFTFDELERVLKHFGYNEIKKGKTAGSRRAFVREATSHIIRLHKPHPANILKLYVIDYVLKELKDQRLI